MVKKPINKKIVLFSVIFVSFILMAANVSAAQSLGIWALDEKTGTSLSDNSTYNNIGTLKSTSSDIEWCWTLGHINSGLRFDYNYKDRVEIPAQTRYNFTKTQSFSLMAWVKSDASGRNRWQGVVTKGRDKGEWYGIWISSSNKWVFGGQSNNIFGSTVTDGWHHVAIVQDGATQKRYLYVDGSLVASGSSTNATKSAPIILAGCTVSSEYFDGKIDHVYLGDYAMSTATVKANYEVNKTKLNVMNYTQQPYGSLCWATSSSMAASYFNEDITDRKVTMAKYIHGSTGWNKAGDAQDCIDCVKKYAGKTGTIKSGLSFNSCKSNIDNDKPVIVRIGWKDAGGKLNGSGHYLVMRGYSGSSYIYINDPWDGNVHLYSHSSFSDNNSQKWTHSITY